MSLSATDPDPSQPDLYWAGFSGWATVPGLFIGGIVSVVVMLGLPPLGHLVHLREDVIVLIRFWIVLLAWIAVSLIWLYRGASFVFRLTPTLLHMDFGMFYPPQPPIRVSDIIDVECRAWVLRRLFHVGSVIVRSVDRPPVRLPGIYHPELFAAAIRTAATHARHG